MGSSFFDSSVFEIGALQGSALLPYLVLCLGAAVATILAGFKAKPALMRAAVIITLSYFIYALFGNMAGPPVEVFGTSLEIDIVTRFVGTGVAILGIICTFFSRSSDEGKPTEWGPVLLLFILGLSLLPAARDWVAFFVFLETLAICGYVLTALDTHRERSLEAGLKYLMMGSFASALFLMGATLLYGLCGSFDFDRIREALEHLGPNQMSFAVTGATLIVVSLAFKVALFPFHMWAPDVYQGAPTGFAAFMASATKLSVFAALAVSASSCKFMNLAPVHSVLLALSLASIIFGSLMAAAQTQVRRLLAYASIVSAGYAGLAVNAGPSAYGALLLYLFVYGLGLICAFAMVEVFSLSLGQESHDDVDLKKIGAASSKLPAVAKGLFAVAVFSLAGIPPLPGFLTKYSILMQLWIKGEVLGAVVLCVGTFLGLAYYLKLFVPLYLDSKSSDRESVVLHPSKRLVWSATFAGTLAIVVLFISLGGFSRFFQWMSLAEGFAR